jgi:hypothetical protein
MDDLSTMPPDRLFDLFERGEIDRETLQTLMALHARRLIEEIKEDHLNPAAAFVEHLRNVRATIKLVRRHGQRIIRDTLSVLAKEQQFPPSMLLWNASHPDVPLYCFIRMKREPVFRILRFVSEGSNVEIQVEHGRTNSPGGLKRETFILKRDASWNLHIASRTTNT